MEITPTHLKHTLSQRPYLLILRGRHHRRPEPLTKNSNSISYCPDGYPLQFAAACWSGSIPAYPVIPVAAAARNFMHRARYLLVIFIILASLIVVTPALIKALPDRYVLRLPQPLQKYGLPEDSVALLPTTQAPRAAEALISTAVPAEQLPVVATEEATAAVENQEFPTESLPQTVEHTPQPTATATPRPTPTLMPTRTPTPWPLPQTARLQGIQHQFQTWNNCGPATLAMSLSFFGEQVYQEQTAAVLKPDPEDRNVSPQEMADYVNEQTPYRAIYRANGDIQTLKRLLANEMPVIIETGIDPPGEFRWLGWYGHYLLPVAYDDELQQVWVYDSWFGTSEEPLTNAHPDGRVITYEDLQRDWAQFNRSYIALYREEQEPLLREIIGLDMDDDTMWQAAVDRAGNDINRDPQNAFYWFNLGTNYVAMQDYEDAAIAFDQARAIGLPWRMLWYQFGPYEAYLNTSRYDDIVLLADATLQDRPYFEESYYYRGLALAELGDNAGAVQDLERAASFNPNFEPAQVALDRIK